MAIVYDETWYNNEMSKVYSKKAREFIAELVGTFAFTTLSLMSTIWAVTACPSTRGLFLPAVNGVSVMIGMYICGGYSGGALDPGLTMGFYVTSRYAEDGKKGRFKRVIQMSTH